MTAVKSSRSAMSWFRLQIKLLLDNGRTQPDPRQDSRANRQFWLESLDLASDLMATSARRVAASVCRQNSRTQECSLVATSREQRCLAPANPCPAWSGSRTTVQNFLHASSFPDVLHSLRARSL